MVPSATPIRALLFDFDEVLADTEPLHWRAWREVLRPFGIDLDWETFEQTCIGITDTEMLNQLCTLATKPVTPDAIRAHYPEKRQLFRDFADGRTLIDCKLIELFKSLAMLRLGVVTSSNKSEVEPILLKSGLLDLMNVAVYGNDVRHYKPHPEPYLLAVQRLRVAACDTVVFEDSAAGMRSAREAGCRVVQVDDVAQVPALVRTAVGEIFSRL
ncbi:MAG: HAD family phosphatase [Bryobacteraceae bacterium]|jgi:HAD superfamily hydrolase (TIGR01509 family)